jgi:Zn-finger nucleic acid-binding protein
MRAACRVCEGTGAVRTPEAKHGSGIDACPRCAELAELAWMDRKRVEQLERDFVWQQAA